MIGYLRSRHFEKIRTYFKRVVDAKNSSKRSRPPIAPIPSPDASPTASPAESPASSPAASPAASPAVSASSPVQEPSPLQPKEDPQQSQIEESRAGYLKAAALLKAFAEDPAFTNMRGVKLYEFINKYIAM